MAKETAYKLVGIKVTPVEERQEKIFNIGALAEAAKTYEVDHWPGGNMIRLILQTEGGERKTADISQTGDEFFLTVPA